MFAYTPQGQGFYTIWQPYANVRSEPEKGVCTMHIRPSFFPRRLLIACAVGASLAAPAAMAANSMSDAQAQYRADVERCNAGDTNQDKATCLREAGAALQEARRNRLLRGSPSYEENQRARCDRLPGA